MLAVEVDRFKLMQEIGHNSSNEVVLGSTPGRRSDVGNISRLQGWRKRYEQTTIKHDRA